MRPHRRWLLAGAALAAVGGGGWFGWGAWQARRFDARWGELRAAGRLSLLAEVDAALPPEAENAWPLLAGATRQAQDTESQALQEVLEEGDSSVLDPPADREAWTPEQRAYETEVLRRLEPAFATLDRALERPRLVCTGTAPLASGALADVLRAGQLLTRRAQAQPARTAGAAAALADLLERWEPRTAADAGVRGVFWRTLVVALLREGVERGHVPVEALEAWDVRLAAQEARVLEDLRRADLWARATGAWLLASWRQGEDPTASLRRSFGETLAAMPLPSGDDDLGGRIAGLRATLEAPYPAWYEWPRRQAYLRERLEEAAGREPVAWDLDRLRRAVVDGTAAAAVRSRAVPALHALAALRLARVALAARRAVDGGMGSAFDLRVGVAARLGDRHLYDALGEELFRMEARDGVIVAQPRPSVVLDALDPELGALEGAALEERLHDDHLLWRVPAPPR